ncbi:MAG: FAD-binding oxidoreductase [Gammaproteobacteria bacterium]|nr:FAD-binding oxidoreductase [Gammaproteobacteria bacterium]
MSEFINGLRAIVGDRHAVTRKDALKCFTEELRGRYQSDCMGVVFPGSTEEVSRVIRFCAAHGMAMVPQGGNTGAMGGTVSTPEQLIVNLQRLDRIVEVDRVNQTMTVQAGCILANIQEAAKDAGLLFPLSLGAQGSCQIGGNIATNAGGINVLQYGNTRDLVLGIEVVLADGRVWQGLNRLRKNNTGYDLRHLFIGSEGTLGIITAAVLKLFPYPGGRIVSLIGVETVSAALELMVSMKSASSDRLTSFELMSQRSVETAVTHMAQQRNPFDRFYPWYILAVVDSTEPDPQLRSRIETALEQAWTDSIVRDAVIAESESQSARLMLLREDIVEAQKFLGGSIKHDVAVPISCVPDFMDSAYRAIRDYMPEAVPYPYGHLGDGNLHFNITQPPNMDREVFLGHWKTINTLVHDIAHHYHGSFSAEHGIGITKLDEMEKYKSETELDLLRDIKSLFDPHGILNPGKVIR